MIVCATFFAMVARAETVSIVVASNAAPRVMFGAEKIAESLKAAKVDAVVVPLDSKKLVSILNAAMPEETGGRKIYISPMRGGWESESFTLTHLRTGQSLAILAGSDSGLLYGCLELATRIRIEGKLPAAAPLDFVDKPAMTLRGTCIGLQKTFILPGRKVYEYPITPDLFPWFYDKKLWTEYLDFLVENRMNTLYLWSGHPFASLVRLKDYPYAVEVPENVFQQNQAMYRWLAAECDKRGIWLVQMFYNIIVSKPFAETNHISTQLSAPTPLVSDYTRKSIAEFVKEFPHVGLLVCLGEALRGTPNQLNWCTNVILPGVLDGMKEAGLKEKPPIVIRTHAMDAYAIMPAAYQAYSNLFTMTKYNGESLTTWQPRGKDQAVQLAMAKLGPHIVNVHILSNLEPFRYGDVNFIKKSVQASRDRLGATGIHLYPLAYWNWPYSPDKSNPPLLQWKRDWIWFTAWARYAWNPDVPEQEDRGYWIGRLAEHYGNTNAAEKILNAYNAAGEVAPRLIRRFGITEGNRQTLSLGMTLDQLVNPSRYGAIADLWESQSPPGERLDEFVKKEWNHEPHAGETPPSILGEVLEESSNAVVAANMAKPLVEKNRAEFERFQHDTRCIQAMAENYAAKVRAAELDLRYNYSHDIRDLEQAETNLAASLDAYQKLVSLTKDSYRFANSMQTSQRKIPFAGGASGHGTNYLWSQVLPYYQKELADFQARVEKLKQNPNAEAAVDESKIKPWPAAPFTIIGTNAEIYTVQEGTRPFMDRYYKIQKLAPELKGLTGIRFSHEAAKSGHYDPVVIEAAEPVRVLVGYFKSPREIWLQVPKLETAAQADERGGIDTVLENAATIQDCPGLNVHVFRYGAGRNKLEFIGQGSFVILGVVPDNAQLEKRDTRIGAK